MNFIKDVREKLKNPKTRSLTLLGMYAVFFIIVFILFSMSDSKTSNYVPPIEDEKIEYSYIVYQNGQIIETSKFEYEVIERLIEESISETKYKDSNKIIYNIDLYKYFEVTNELDNCDEITCDDIDILIEINKDEFIKNVKIDLSNYYGYEYLIEIDYYIGIKD